MRDKVKTSIIIDRKLWEEFKSRIASEKGLKSLSRAIEEAIEEEISDILIIEAFKDQLRKGETPLIITPVKPRIATNAGKIVRELRDSRT
jgi:metal-responsive CopG/Arc/MetJ family transcriptional regulator